MKIIDRYILTRFLQTFFFVVLILILVIVVIDITEKTEKFAKNNLSASEILGYYLDFIPFMANLLTPITVFIATVYVTAKMAGHTEIIAILSGGTSFRRLMLPYFIGAAIIGGISFYLTGWVIPNSNKSRIAFELEYFKSNYRYDKTNVHIQVAHNTYLYLMRFNNQSNIGYRFTLERIDSTVLLEKLTADRIQWLEEEERWRLINWRNRKIDGMHEIITQGKEMDTTLVILPSEFGNDYKEYDGMTIPELNDQINTLRFRGASNVEVYEVEKYIRFTSPFTVIILAMMGVIVSAKKRRGGAGFQIALGFFLSFVFILLFTMTKSIAETGAINPMYSVWIPNITFAGITLLLYKTVPR